MTRPITVQYYKHPDTPHWRHELVLLGEDRHGIWLGGRKGTVVQRGGEPARSLDRAMAQLITPSRWWTALFNGAGDHDMPIYVDVTTVARWPQPDLVVLTDLDLDVVRRRDGSVYIDDEDEFEQHRVSRAYPPQWVAAARAAAARLVLDLEDEVAPFDGTAERWLDLVS